MHFTGFKRLAASAVLLAFASAAWAQYVWIDDKGTKQFSDMPPPASVPANRILKQPGKGTATAAPASAAAEDSAAKAPPSLADRNAEYNKRRAAQAEKEKKAEQEAQAARDKAKNCDNARTYQRALESGRRLASTDQNGERVFMTDEQRSREMQETSRVLAGCN